MEKTVANSGVIRVKVKNSNFDMFYKHEGEKSHLVSFIYKYQLIDIQYICNIKKNKFKLENIMKLSTSIRYIREVAKSLKNDTNGLKIEAKKKDYMIVNAKNSISFF